MSTLLRPTRVAIAASLLTVFSGTAASCGPIIVPQEGITLTVESAARHRGVMVLATLMAMNLVTCTVVTLGNPVIHTSTKGNATITNR